MTEPNRSSGQANKASDTEECNKMSTVAGGIFARLVCKFCNCYCSWMRKASSSRHCRTKN